MSHLANQPTKERIIRSSSHVDEPFWDRWQLQVGHLWSAELALKDEPNGMKSYAYI